VAREGGEDASGGLAEGDDHARGAGERETAVAVPRVRLPGAADARDAGLALVDPREPEDALEGEAGVAHAEALLPGFAPRGEIGDEEEGAAGLRGDGAGAVHG
jgi:hypothetical protein